MNRVSRRIEIIGTYDRESVMCLVRLLLIPACLVTASVMGTALFNEIQPSPMEQAAQIQQDVALVSHLPAQVIALYVLMTHPQTLRYMIAPAFAILFVTISAARFLKDIYALGSIRDAERYIGGSMFSLEYPEEIIDKGKATIPSKKVNLIEKIGGPGFVLIQPGNAAMFRRLREPSGARLTSTYFLEPFETLAQTIYLDDQQGDRDEVSNLITRDGIRVILKDVHFRYRIKQLTRNGVQVRKSLEDPYPYDSEAMEKVAFDVTVTDKGQEEWSLGVERTIIGGITDFIASKKLDELTAPVDGVRNPRLELCDDVLFKTIQRALSRQGAELIWIDVGHLDIVDESVDNQRTDLWAADWVGDAEVTRAFGEAKRQAYQELGRAEAQAELILSIMDALNDTVVETSSAPNIRKLLVVRTAQIIEDMKST